MAICNSGKIMKLHNVPFCFAFIAVAAVDPVLAQDEISDRARVILEKNCYQCHGIDHNFEDLDVLDGDILLMSRGSGSEGVRKKPFVTPGKPELSKIWEPIADGSMPPGEELSASDKATIRQWIENGAPFKKVTREERPFVSEDIILTAILADVRSLTDRGSRELNRYFSLANLHNNPGVSSEQLRLTRAALSKAINSLSRESSIVQPRLLPDTHDTVYAVDLYDLGWDEDLRRDGEGWNRVLKTYPYCVQPTEIAEFRKYREITRHFGHSFMDAACYMRADWFIEAATRPPLYESLLKLPNTLDELAEGLGIDINRNIAEGKIKRGAVLKSGVSAQNRLVDRHSLSRGAPFWVSYDFAANAGRSNVARFPLGPQFPKEKQAKYHFKFNDFAFTEDGSEIIWELSNGLHGYMIVDGKGHRIDRAPASIVWNKALANGNPEVINGATCMGCHMKGIRDFEDILLDSHAVRKPDPLERILEIVLEQDDMDRLIERDRSNYLQQLERAIGPFLKVGDDRNKDITRFPEPVSKVIAKFNQPLSITDVACELGLQDSSRLTTSGLGKLGLGVLERENGEIQRTFWAPTPEDRAGEPTTRFAIVVGQLDLGEPRPADAQ